jgi:hypothetical protein
MGNRVSRSIGGSAAIVLLVLGAMSLVPGSTPTRSAPPTGNFKNAVARLRGSRIETALRPVPPVHDAIWPPLPSVFT